MTSFFFSLSFSLRLYLIRSFIMMANESESILVEKYDCIARQLTIYGGIILFILCLFGTLMNMLTFAQPTYQRRPSSFYLLLASIFDLAHLTPGSITNILQYGFHYDWTINSIIYCRLKTYFVYVFTIISGTLTILANIDRYLLSSNNSKRWNYSSHSIAKRLIVSTISFWLILSIPMIFCTTRYYHSSHNEQMIGSNPSMDSICLIVRIFYTCLFDGFFPPLIMLIFGLVTYRNVHQLHRRSNFRSLSARRINQQIIFMLILQSIKSSFASMPYSFFHTYWLITRNKPKTHLDEAKENLAMQIVYLLFWSNYTSFFIYLFSSEIFRSQWKKGVKKLVCCLYGSRRRRHTKCEIELKRLNYAQNTKEILAHQQIDEELGEH